MVCIHIGRIAGQRFLKVIGRFGIFVPACEQMPEIVVGLRHIRLDDDRLAEG